MSGVLELRRLLLHARHHGGDLVGRADQAGLQLGLQPQRVGRPTAAGPRGRAASRLGPRRESAPRSRRPAPGRRRAVRPATRVTSPSDCASSPLTTRPVSQLPGDVRRDQGRRVWVMPMSGTRPHLTSSTESFASRRRDADVRRPGDLEPAAEAVAVHGRRSTGMGRAAQAERGTRWREVAEVPVLAARASSSGPMPSSVPSTDDVQPRAEARALAAQDHARTPRSPPTWSAAATTDSNMPCPARCACRARTMVTVAT